ncbi:MAG: Uma2 family endonuclease [Euzebya sp.]
MTLALHDQHKVRQGKPLAVDGENEPEPDLAVTDATGPDQHPSTAALLIEVAQTTQRLDLGEKSQRYAAASVHTYVVLDLPNRRAVVHTGPSSVGVLNPRAAHIIAHAGCYGVGMRVVVDSSSLISLAWSGQLDLLRVMPLEVVIPPGVYAEVVTTALDRGHADAAAIETALQGAEVAVSASSGSVDDHVVAAAAVEGLVLTNDQVLGRRASNLGARWLRTADLVVLLHGTRAIEGARARAALIALQTAGRITTELRDAYLEEL